MAGVFDVVLIEVELGEAESGEGREARGGGICDEVFEDMYGILWSGELGFAEGGEIAEGGVAR